MNKYYYIQLCCTTRSQSMYRNCNVTEGVTNCNKFMWLHHKAIKIFLTQSKQWVIFKNENLSIKLGNANLEHFHGPPG